MQIQCAADAFSRGFRVLAFGLAIVLGIEWGQPILSLAQPNGLSTSATVANEELPPIQEVEAVETRSPIYKRWWFWTIAAVLVGGAAIAMAGGGGSNGGSGSSAQAPGGPVTISGPPPR